MASGRSGFTVPWCVQVPSVRRAPRVGSGTVEEAAPAVTGELVPGLLPPGPFHLAV